MRRRIHHFDLSDITGDPYAYDLDFPERFPALYDEDLWQRYLTAQRALDDAKEAIYEALTNEDFDDVERALAMEAKELVIDDEITDATLGASIRARALAHAGCLYKNTRKTLTPEAQARLDALLDKYKP